MKVINEHFRIQSKDLRHLSITYMAKTDISSPGLLRRPEQESISQATKGVRWMPWRQESKKDAISCEKTWGAASRP